MSGLLPGSPAKLQRVERHLSRQRGAGVRNLATSFGFSFALAAAPISQEPPTKRRKSAHKSTDEPAGASGEKVEAPKDITAVIKPKSEVKPKVRRRFEPVEEHEAVISRDKAKDSSTTAVKRKGRPRKKDVHIEVEELPAASAVPLGRPRRQAAASALAKVTEGFVEEETSIDKKRRDPEPEKAARRGRKKAAPVAFAETVFVEGKNDATAQSTSQEAEFLTRQPPARRVPLGETHANIPSRSPEKRSKLASNHTAEDDPPVSPGRKVRVKVARTKRSVSRTVENQQPAPMIEHSEDSNPTVPRKVRATRDPKCESGAPLAKDGEEAVPVSENPLQESCHGGRAAEKRTGPLEHQKSLPRNGRLATGKRKTQVKPTGMTAKAQAGDEDIDWLFETTEKRSLPSRRQTQRKPAAKKTQRAKLPDVDLDEMLSNIASWAPKPR